MRPGRVFNGVDRVPVQFVIAGWRVGLITAGFAVALAAATFWAVTIHVALGVFVGIIALVVFGTVVRVIHKSDPHHNLSELTVYRLALFGSRARYITNY